MGDRRWWRPRRHIGARGTPEPPEPTLEVGQVWRYRARPGEEHSRARILVLEHHPDLGEVVHVRIDGVRIPNPVFPERPNTVLGHLPIEGVAFRGSLLELVGTVGGTGPDEADLEGYRAWRDAGGGVFTLSVADTVQAVEATLTGGS